MKFSAIFCVVSLVWCVAVLFKLATARSRREPYRFGQWDGGLLLRGQTIGRTGSAVLGGFCIACCATAAYLLHLMEAL